MVLILRKFWQGYNFLFNEYKGEYGFGLIYVGAIDKANMRFETDPRVEQYPFLGSPIPIALLVIGYVYFVLRIGPRIMQDRKPFDLTNIIIVYNFIQVVANLYLGVVVRHDCARFSVYIECSVAKIMFVSGNIQLILGGTNVPELYAHQLLDNARDDHSGEDHVHVLYP